jgi:tricorn protease
MWIKNNKTGESNIYFVSDRSGTLNLYKYDTKTEAVKKLTKATDWDVRWASSDGRSKIVYEFGGELKLFNAETEEIRDIPVQVPHDGLSMRASRYDVSKNIESFALSPGGKRAAIVARGDVFTVPAEKGAARNLTQTCGAHDREAVWSFDGATIAFLSDQTGEDQIYLVNQMGNSVPEQLTDCFAARLTNLDWSPDGKFVAVKTSDNRLYVVPVQNSEDYEKGIPREVVQDTNGGSLDYAWSACGQYIALTLDETSGFSSLYIWEAKTRDLHRITDPYSNIFSPCWDPEGKYLYYLARHEYAPQFSSLEWNYAGNRNIGIFALALRKDVPSLLSPQSDEVEIKAASQPSAEEETKKSASESNQVKETSIDFDGLARRVVRFPLSFENYSQLSATKQFLFYVQSGAGFYGRESSEKPSIRMFDLKERKETKLTDNSGSYALSPDGSKIIYSHEGSLKIANANSVQQTPTTLPTGDLAVDRVPAEEWEEIFNEVCRKFRDYFYVKNMHGYDWKAICDQYRALLPYVAHRSDLNYVIGEMISELNAGHAYIQGGDFTVPRRAKVGLPGAQFELDAEAGRYKISKIFQGQNEEPKYRAPLTEIGVEINIGDYVLEIDGKELLGNDNPYRLLQNKMNPITLTVNNTPTLEGARKVVYQPVDSEANLLYLDFVKDRMERVAKATDGKVGYIHLPDMGAPGAYEFIKWYYPQIRKEGMVVDVRSNGGGNISQWIIMRLNQKLLGTRYGSGGKESPSTYPYTVFHGQLTCLINETSASDGDIFPYYFRKSGLGPLIGKRSWGGVVGISGRGALLDGGEVMVPLSATNDEHGEYIIEGKGVTPDIEVDNDPKSVLEGRDLQLERGIEEVLRRIEIDPKSLPTKRPDDPVKTKDAIKNYE